MIFSKKRSKSTNVNSLKDGNIDIVDKQEILYFCSVGEELANKIEDCVHPLLNVCNE